MLPDATLPWITLDINGLTYRYTLDKDPNADAKVHVRNQDTASDGYVFEETDDWSQMPGGTIQKFFRFPYVDATRWGDGEMAIEGDGSITDPLMIYNYRMGVDEMLMKCTANPLVDPSCPGYRDALLEYLKGLTNPSVDDPFYDEWVQAQLNRETELEEDDVDRKEDQKEEDLEKRMGGKNTVEAMVDTKQQESILAALAALPKIEPYYTVTIQGGEYEETIRLEDKEIPDNRRALSNLASDAKHKTMVRSQYDREQ